MRILIFRVNARFHRCVPFPNRLASERQLGELFDRLVPRDIQKLFTILFVHFQTMPAALKVLAERPHVLPVGIEHEDRRMILLVFVSFVNHIQIAGLVERHIVRRLPRELIRQLRPVVNHFIFVLAFAQNERRLGLLRGENGRQTRDPRGPSYGSGCHPQKLPPTNRRSHVELP